MKTRLNLTIHKTADLILVVLILVIALPIPMAMFDTLGKMLFCIGFSLLILSGMAILIMDRRYIRIGIAFGSLAIFSAWLSLFIEFGDILIVIRNITIAAYLCCLFAALLRHLDLSGQVTFRTFEVALAGYIILGLIGGQICDLLYHIDPDSFKLQNYTPLKLTYFSIVTLTTLGYGDIVPENSSAQSMSLLISISGQIYISVLIAIISGKYVSHINESRR